MQYIQKEPKNTEKHFWTEHAKAKLKQYGLSSARVVRVINYPKRRERAIVPACIACMQQIGNKKKTEIWTMHQTIKDSKKIKIITAWRYPGITKPGMPIPIPQDIAEQIQEII